MQTNALLQLVMSRVCKSDKKGLQQAVELELRNQLLNTFGLSEEILNNLTLC